MAESPVYELERTFKAPRRLVWKTWTEPKLLARWYGPNVETIVHALDVKPGGLWLNEMKWGDNSHFQKMEYTEVIEAEKLVGLMSNTDANWNVIPNPQMENWPKVLLTTVTFEDQGNQTKMTLHWEPHQASDEEIAGFANAIANLGRGWDAGMLLLAELLQELQT